VLAGPDDGNQYVQQSYRRLVSSTGVSCHQQTQDSISSSDIYFGKTGRTILAPVSTASKSSVFGSWWHTPVLGVDLLIDYTELCVTLNQDLLVIPPASSEGGVIKCEDRGYSSGAETIRVAYRRAVPQVRRGFDGAIASVGAKEWHALRDRDVTAMDGTGIAGMLVMTSM
jgi:hypothetical protein